MVVDAETKQNGEFRIQRKKLKPEIASASRGCTDDKLDFPGSELFYISGLLQFDPSNCARNPEAPESKVLFPTITNPNCDAF